MISEKDQLVECQNLIREYMNKCKFGVPDDAGKALGNLLMLTTMALDSIMGAEYAMRTILQVSELMESGKPPQRVKVEMINRSKLN